MNPHRTTELARTEYRVGCDPKVFLPLALNPSQAQEQKDWSNDYSAEVSFLEIG
jgi:hypothetical protein